jgi:hypothetical protein
MKKDFLRVNKLIVNLHGGLGNQIFQIHYAQCMMIYLQIREIQFFYSINNKTPRCLSRKLLSTTSKPNIFTKLRVAKVLEKLKINEGIFILNNTYYLDGYFQSPEIFEKFSDEILFSSLIKLKNLFIEDHSKNNRKLIHLRLTDFFLSRDSAFEFLNDYLENLPENADIFTDDEDLISNIKFFRNKNFSLISTSNLDPENILIEMSKYNTIYSNNSTLSFWASCLSGSVYISYLKKYDYLHSRFKSILHPVRKF